MYLQGIQISLLWFKCHIQINLDFKNATYLLPFFSFLKGYLSENELISKQN